jgi:biopolymer transport protein ExbD
MKNRRRFAESTNLMITPMIDMFTVILIFLIVSYAPEQTRIKKSAGISLPKTSLNLEKVPQIQVEVSQEIVSLNGSPIQGLKPSGSNARAWTKFKSQLDALQRSDEPVLVMADKGLSYDIINMTVAHLAAAGFSEVYFLTDKLEERK